MRNQTDHGSHHGQLSRDGVDAPKLVLASASPRRRELLSILGVPFTVEVADVDESRVIGESPEDLARRLAEEKAITVLKRLRSVAVVIGADTVVALPDGEVLGKPKDDDDAAHMLRQLSGKEHLVHTGFAIVSEPASIHVSSCVTTRVRFSILSDGDIAAYVATGEPRDKAGAYGIQGAGGLFVRTLTGSYSSVVGLPLAEVHEALRRSGLWSSFPMASPR